VSSRSIAPAILISNYEGFLERLERKKKESQRMLNASALSRCAARIHL